MPPPPLLAGLVAALASLGQFAISAYLPGFDEIGRSLSASSAQVQYSLTAYLVPFAVAMLWHGAIADALGRRHFILCGLLVFLLASLICTFADSIELLYVGRALQGVSAGIGLVVGRTMISDLYEGRAAQRQMALFAIFFTLSPAVAPICGGWLLPLGGWRSIFALLAAITAVLWLACWYWLPETLPRARRQSLHPLQLARGFAGLLGYRYFMLIALSNAAVNAAIYLYVLAAPTLVTQHLGLSPQSFGWVFIPLVGGMFCGALLAFRLASSLAPGSGILLGHGLMSLANLINIGLAIWLAPGLPWTILTLPLFALGMTLTQPALQLFALECFADRRGLASSGYATLQQGVNALSSALIVPLLLASTLDLALGVAALQVLALLIYGLACREGPRQLRRAGP